MTSVRNIVAHSCRDKRVMWSMSLYTSMCVRNSCTCTSKKLLKKNVF